MNIGVDLRALGSDTVSGVTVYLRNVLTELLRLDKKNNYFLWFNSARRMPLRLEKLPRNPRVEIVHTHYSNRFLNARLRLNGAPLLDELIQKNARRGTHPLDIFWLPDPRPVALSSACVLVATIHDLSPTLYPQFFSWKTRVWHRFLQPDAIARRAEKILAVSHATATDLQKSWQIPARKISVTPLGVPANFRRASPIAIAKLRRKYGLPRNFVLALSTLEPRKNLAVLVRAFGELKRDTDLPHELVLAGVENRRIFASPKIKSRRAKKFVRRLGFIPESEKAALISAADVFCFPSIYEGFGLPALEALAVGTPLLAADIPSLREVAGRSAIFVRPRNVDAWKVALQKVLTQTAVAQKLSTAGQQRAREFRWRKTAAQTLQAFADTASGSSF